MLTKKPAKKKAVPPRKGADKPPLGEESFNYDSQTYPNAGAVRVTTITQLPPSPSGTPKKTKRKEPESKMKRLITRARRDTDPGPGLNFGTKSFSTSALPDYDSSPLSRNTSSSASSIVVPAKLKRKERKERDMLLDRSRETLEEKDKVGRDTLRESKERENGKDSTVGEKEAWTEKEESNGHEKASIREKGKEKENYKEKRKDKEEDYAIERLSEDRGNGEPTRHHKIKPMSSYMPGLYLPSASPLFPQQRFGSPLAGSSDSSGFYDETATLPSPTSIAPTATRVVKLNIGGYKYITTALTLTSRGENFFTTLLSEKYPVVKDEEGAYFIDRDGEYFKPLLSFLRTGELRIPHGMSKMCVEREAHFYLINLNNDGIQPMVHHTPYFPPSMGIPHPIGHNVSPIRYDGVYLQKTRDGENIYAYYHFFREEPIVRIVMNAQYKVANRVQNHYELIEGTFVLIRSVINRKTTVLMARADPLGQRLTIQWRNPRDPQHVDDDVLTFFPSFDPVPGLVFSNQASRLRKREFHRLYIKDTSNISITVVERESKTRMKHVSKRTATYRTEKEPLSTVIINDDFFSVGMISLGAVLLETRQDRLSSGHIACYVYLALERQEEEDEECDEIDIYTFLRTSSPPVVDDDEFSSDEDEEYKDPYAPRNRPERSLSQ